MRARNTTAVFLCLSPSPCESIGSVSDDVFFEKENGNAEADEIGKPTSTTRPKSQIVENSDIQEYLHSFERRNSDTSFLVNRRSSVGERMNLAEEIRKLSDHLMMLAEINKTLGKDKEKEKDNSGELTPTPENSVSQPSFLPKPKTSKLSVRLQKSIEETPTLTTTSSTSSTSSVQKMVIF
uniref:Uncharacterized protein n=1 Tax=Megaselia scalaris TaxID=36166 RepID=T1GZW4_MEGSC